METYKTKGYINFCHTKEGLKYKIVEKEEFLKPFNGDDFLHYFERHVYD